MTAEQLIDETLAILETQPIPPRSAVHLALIARRAIPFLTCTIGWRHGTCLDRDPKIDPWCARCQARKDIDCIAAGDAKPKTQA